MREKSLHGVVRIRHIVSYYFLHYTHLVITAVVLLSFATAAVVGAVTSISQSYSTSERLSLGSLVSLKENTSDQVVAAATSNVDNLLGIAISADNSLLSISNGEDNQIQVATSGTVQVLVSDINGPIVKGDHITASPISGVGMKATSNARVVGITQGSVTNSNGSQQKYKDKSGKEHTVALKEVPLLVNVSYYFKEPDKTIVPSALQNIADSLAGKNVSTLPILISAAIFLVMLITVATIIYSMIHSSIISVGRNPMSQSAVYRNLIQISVVVLIILAVGFSAIYMILTRL